MGPDPIQALIQEDQRLQVGDNVVARWSRNGYYFRVRARVTSLSTRKARVRLLETPTRGQGYTRGDTIEIPRITDHERWSSNSCVRRSRTSRTRKERPDIRPA